MATISKIIHYVWVGNGPLTPLAQKCIKSWQVHLPDYEFRFWNEGNSPMTHPYVQEMYKQKKWAFVSDYIRFWALEKEGGIYLDTDMEVLKSLDVFLVHEGFVGKSKSGNIESSIIGASFGAEFIINALAFYDNVKNYSISDTSPIILEKTIGNTKNCEVKVYDWQYFFPCDEGEEMTLEDSKFAYTNHHWAESWVPYARLRKMARRLGIIKVLKSFLNKSA